MTGWGGACTPPSHSHWRLTHVHTRGDAGGELGEPWVVPNGSGDRPDANLAGADAPSRRTCSVPWTATGATGRRFRASGADAAAKALQRPARIWCPPGNTTTPVRARDRAGGASPSRRQPRSEGKAPGVQHPGLPALLGARGRRGKRAGAPAADDERVEEAAVVGGQQQRPATGDAGDRCVAGGRNEERNEERADPVDDWVIPSGRRW